MFWDLWPPAWLGGPPKFRTKHLNDLLEHLLAATSSSGEDAFLLEERELKRLCSAARDALLRGPSLVDIDTDAQVVVVGDLHGQFCDLQRIIARLGRPGSDDGKVWVFLGDYVDRGPMGLEIVATLLALKLRHPTHVHLLRGNHECSEITVLFGFCGECQRRSTLAAWEAVMQVFDALPLAALLNGRVFLCHGGIGPDLQHPRDINSIARPVDVSPSEGGVIADLLWADPSPHVSGWCANPRGVSHVFGLDVARAWMKAHGLRAIVRAHMVQEAGFEVLGNNEVMTVFSAADYRGSGNTGAVLVIAASLDFEFVTFPSPRPPSQGSLEAELQDRQRAEFASPLLLARAPLPEGDAPMPVAPRCPAGAGGAGGDDVPSTAEHD